MALPAEITDLGARLRNWGRWGDDDELGTLNLLDDACRRRGIAAAVEGTAFSLALDWSDDGPQIGLIPGRENPAHTMTQVNAPVFEPDGVLFNDDAVAMGLQAATHWDGLAHVSYGGRLYNGYPADTVSALGVDRLSIHRVGPLAGRGVLLDVARLRGVDRLDGGFAIGAGVLDEACEQARVAVQPGDIVLVHTGHLQLLPDREAYASSTPGLDTTAAAWMKAHDVAAVATDTLALEVFPGERDDAFLPVHYLHIVEMGLTQGQNWVLGPLAEACAADGRYDFLLVAPPEPMVGGAGAPVHPVALR
jgi:kynurenine formamidase